MYEHINRTTLSWFYFFNFSFTSNNVITIYVKTNYNIIIYDVQT